MDTDSDSSMDQSQTLLTHIKVEEGEDSDSPPKSDGKERPLKGLVRPPPKRPAGYVPKNPLRTPQLIGTIEWPEGPKDLFKGSTFYATGVLDTITYASLKRLIHHWGAKYSRFGSNVDFLVVGRDPGPSKVKRAQLMGMKVLNEQELYELVTSLINNEAKFPTKKVIYYNCGGEKTTKKKPTRNKDGSLRAPRGSKKHPIKGKQFHLTGFLTTMTLDEFKAIIYGYGGKVSFGKNIQAFLEYKPPEGPKLAQLHTGVVEDDEEDEEVDYVKEQEKILSGLHYLVVGKQHNRKLVSMIDNMKHYRIKILWENEFLEMLKKVQAEAQANNSTPASKSSFEVWFTQMKQAVIKEKADRKKYKKNHQLKKKEEREMLNPPRYKTSKYVENDDSSSSESDGENAQPDSTNKGNSSNSSDSDSDDEGKFGFCRNEDDSDDSSSNESEISKPVNAPGDSNNDSAIKIDSNA